MSSKTHTSQIGQSSTIVRERLLLWLKQLGVDGQVLLLTGFGCVFWTVLAGPAWLVAGLSGLFGLTVSLLLSLLSGIAVVVALGRVMRTQPLIAILGSGFRMAVVLGGGLIVRSVQPAWGLREFYVWLMLTYVGFLIIETAIVAVHASGRIQTDNGSDFSNPAGNG